MDAGRVDQVPARRVDPRYDAGSIHDRRGVRPDAERRIGVHRQARALPVEPRHHGDQVSHQASTHRIGRVDARGQHRHNAPTVPVPRVIRPISAQAERRDMSRRSGGRSLATATTYGSPPISRRSVSSPVSTRRPSTAAAAPLAATMRPTDRTKFDERHTVGVKRPGADRDHAPHAQQTGLAADYWSMSSVASSRKRPVSNASAMSRVCLVTGALVTSPADAFEHHARPVRDDRVDSELHHEVDVARLVDRPDVDTVAADGARGAPDPDSRLTSANTRAGDAHSDRQPSVAPVRP